MTVFQPVTASAKRVRAEDDLPTISGLRVFVLTQFDKSRAGAQVMIGKKVALPHRIHLVDGRILRGYVFRTPNARLADHLAAQKGYLSITDSVFEGAELHIPYLVLNLAQVLFIEELSDPAGDQPR